MSIKHIKYIFTYTFKMLYEDILKMTNVQLSEDKNNLKWHSHIDLLGRKENSFIYALYPTKFYWNKGNYVVILPYNFLICPALWNSFLGMHKPA